MRAEINEMKHIAILTGDLIASRKADNIAMLIDSLNLVFEEIRNYAGIAFDAEVFRGDSFQIALQNPKDAVLLAVLIRVGLRSKTINNQSMSIHKLWDARIAIGIGNGNVKNKIVESNGEAFELSGIEFDKLKKKHEKLHILTAWKTQNASFDIIVKLLDVMIDRWTNLTSEVVYEYLLKGSTQSEMAKELNVSQPAINKRLNGANIYVIENSIRYISDTIALENI